MYKQKLVRGVSVDTGRIITGYYVKLQSYNGKVSYRIYTGYAETDCDDFYPEYFEVFPSTVEEIVE